MNGETSDVSAWKLIAYQHSVLFSVMYAINCGDSLSTPLSRRTLDLKNSFQKQ